MEWRGLGLVMLAAIAGCGRLAFEDRLLDAGMLDAGMRDADLDATDSNVPGDLVSDLVAYWPLDEPIAGSCTGGGDACNKISNQFEGAWFGNATPAAGKFGNGILLDGSGDWIELGSSKIIDGTEPFTIAAWVRLDASPGVNDQAAIFSRRSGDSPGYLQFSVGTFAADDRLLVLDTHGSTGPQGFIATVEVPLASWHHVAVATDLVAVTFYLDGVANVTMAYRSPSVVGGLPQRLGALADRFNHQFPGKLDEVRIYQRRLTDAEIALLAALNP